MRTKTIMTDNEIEYYVKNNRDKQNLPYFINYYKKTTIKKLNLKIENENWTHISTNVYLTERQLDKYKDKLDWMCICQYKTLTPELIEKFIDKVKWFYISAYQNLTPEQIVKYSDKLYWSAISEHQKLTPEIIKKFENKLDIYYLCNNRFLKDKLEVGIFYE